MGVVLINQSKYIKYDEVNRMADALTVQLSRDVAAAWGSRGARTVVQAGLNAHPSWIPMYLVDDIPEAPGALAYHDVDNNGKPYGRIGVKTTLDSGASVSSAVSHEVVEYRVDPFCQLWAAGPRSLVAYEACDPVENNVYDIDGVEVSDFVYPAYFQVGGKQQQYDHMHVLHAPFTVAHGGYLITMAEGQVTNQWGSEADPHRKDGSRGRTFWRHASAYRLLGGR